MKKCVRLLSALISAVMLLGCIGTAWAEGSGSFCMTASISSATLIQPVRVPYTAGQTVQEALDAAGYRFERSGTFISSIEGAEGNYTIYHDAGNHYDLSLPAADISAVVFSESTNVSDELLALLKYVVDYTEMEGNVRLYPAAQQAYTAALKGLRSADASKAEELLAALQTAVAEYKAIQNGPKYTVTASAVQNSAAVADPILTLTDAYGNVTEAKNAVSVVAGEYTYAVSDGTWNRTQGTLTVSEDAAVSVELPYGEWFGEIRLLNQKNNKAPFPCEQGAGTHTAVYQVPDTVGSRDIILNAGIGNVPDADSTRLYSAYVGTDDIDYGKKALNWSSTAATLKGLVAVGTEDRTFTLEARYPMEDGTVQVQSYNMEILRVPTLSALTVTAEGTQLPLSFDPLTKEYTVTTVADTLDITAVPFDEGYAVSGDGHHDGVGAGDLAVAVSCGERSNTYTVHVEKVAAVDVTLELPADTTAVVYNAASAEIRPVEGVYRLIPGEEYTCVATKNTYYHTKQTFTAAQGVVLRVAEPDTADALTALALYNGSNAKTRIAFTPTPAFDAAQHTLSYTASDVFSALYAQATSNGGYAVKACYRKQTSSAATCGTPLVVPIKQVVSTTGSATALSNCLGAGGYSQQVTLRCEKTAGDITYYQDYELLLCRETHLKGLTLSDEYGTLQLQNEDGTACEYDRDVQSYRAGIDRAAQSVTLNAVFTNESDATPISGGYYALINGVRYDSLKDITLPLDEMQDRETIAVEVCHADENAVHNTYTVQLEKTDPVAVRFALEPQDAAVFVVNNLNGRRILPQEGSFALTPGVSYSYTATCKGYIGQQVSDYIAPEGDDVVTIRLQKAADSNLTQLDAAWPAFRADDMNNGVVSVKTPVEAENSVLYWATQLGEGYSADACGCPIIVDGYLYTYAENRLYKVDTVSGEVVAVGEMDHKSSFAINNPTYADGMLFVGLADGTVQAFNAETLKSLWIYHDVLKGQPNCPIVYHDGYLYTGFWLGETTKANYVCLSATDEDPASPMEEKLPTWTYTQQGGFYWAGAYVSDNYLVVGTDDGKSGYTAGHAQILSLNPADGTVIDRLTLAQPGDQRSAMTFVPEGAGAGKCYFTTKGGYFYQLAVQADGRFGALRSLKLYNYADDAANPAMSTCTPVIYNGRAYIGVSGTAQFGAYSGHNITVIDIPAWDIAYTVRTQGYPQTSGLLTTAYEAETGYVNVYFFDNYTPGKLRMLRDRPGMTAPEVTTAESYLYNGTVLNYDTVYTLFTPYGEQAQYAICSPIADEYGTIYFKNDSAHLMALGSVITELEITTLPDKTDYAAGEAFDPTGMTVTAHYANGTVRDVTAYVEWSEEPLTADDTEFQIFFPYVMYQDKDGQPGSAVEEPFAVLELTVTGDWMPGDVNEDGVVDSKDLSDLLRHVARIECLPETAIAAADLDHSSTVDAADVTLLAGMLTENEG